MLFKVNWEKADQLHDIKNEIIFEMLESYYTRNDIKRFEIISGGCANINIRVFLHHAKLPIILRVYVRDPSVCLKEFAISKLLPAEIPFAKFHYISEYDNCKFAITDYLPGTTLREYLLSDHPEIENIMHQVGQVLAKISKIKFNKSGFFSEDLSIETELNQESLISYLFDLLENKNTKILFSKDAIKSMVRLFDRNKDDLPDGKDVNLVHADFDPANILVDNQNGKWQVSGILDWEFAFSGSTLHDIANMLRYSHKMPELYTKSFLSGMQISGYELPCNWQLTIKLLNIISLLDCLKNINMELNPNRASDIKELINFFTTASKKRDI